MKKKLIDIFKNKSVKGEIPEDSQNYYWYLDESNEPIGISKEISKNEKDLIELMYIRIRVTGNNADNLLWLNFLNSVDMNIDPGDFTSSTSLKFVFFFHDFDADLQLEFESLVHGFDSTFKVFFLEQNYGVILDFTKMDKEQELDVEDFLMASKQDFSSSLVFYHTIRYGANRWLPGKFKAEFDLFREFKDSNTDLMKHKDIFLNYLISSEVVSEHPIFGDWFSQIFLIDTELLAVVKCYLDNGFNITTGSKIMHMHRNTFANKLDRFIELTGLDVKNFDEASIAYLLIRLRRDV